MAKKPKEKKSHWDTVCTEVALHTWEWQAGDITWRWSGKPGINTHAKPASVEEFLPVVHSKTMGDAVLFSLGYDAGRTYEKVLRTREANEVSAAHAPR